LTSETNEYLPSPTEWVRKQVEQYEASNGAEGTTLRGRPVVIVTNRGRKTGGMRKTPLMRVVDGDGYVLVASKGGSPAQPEWYHNLVADPNVEIRDRDQVRPMRVRLVEEPEERARLWALAVEAWPDYADYQTRTERVIPLFRAEPR
jgi:deazaflavin-dependent oxidoreductase (nitroreductase family)